MIGVNPTGFAKNVIDNPIVPLIGGELAEIFLRLKVVRWNIVRRHQCALSDADGAIATLALGDLFANEGESDVSAVASGCVMDFRHGGYLLCT